MSDQAIISETDRADRLKNESMRQRSGNVTDERPLVRFLYRLIRDHLQPGDLEDLLTTIEQPNESTLYSNGWLARYAQDMAERLEVR